MELNLPPEVLEAVSAPGGGRISLVIGAGCSLEAPTSIPLARQCSKECHDRLVANGVLAEGDCEDPSNLSLLADTLFVKLGTQATLVRLLRDYGLKTASPNEGHKLTAALLREGAIGSVLTLNFDLALSTAIADLGDGGVIGIIDRPEDLLQAKRFNLYYLHRNANEADLDLWILRTDALETAWRNTWQDVVTAKVLATPVVVFAGLGSAADVLIESSKHIRSAIPQSALTYQIDPGEADTSAFFRALELDVTYFVKGTWVEFMYALSQRLVSAHAALLKSSALDMVAREQIEPEDLTPLFARILDS